MIENAFNFIPGGSEWIIVIVAAGVLLFGAKKIPELAKTFGKAKGEYKKGENEADKEQKEFNQIFKDKIHSVIVLNIPNQINFIQKEKLSKIVQSCGIPSKTEGSIEKALKNIAKENENAIILCTGSLYFAAEILNLN